jgi:hypothetical protein
MTISQQPFGAVEHMAWWQVQGYLTEVQVVDLGRQLSQVTGMTLDGLPDVRRYPTPGGLGGEGVQVYFAWVESWLIIGTWPDLNLVRVAMSTCAVERFCPEAVTRFLKGSIGQVIKFGCTEW